MKQTPRNHCGRFAARPANRREMYRALEKALANEPDIDWLLDNQERIVHEFYRSRG